MRGKTAFLSDFGSILAHFCPIFLTFGAKISVLSKRPKVPNIGHSLENRGQEAEFKAMFKQGLTGEKL